MCLNCIHVLSACANDLCLLFKLEGTDIVLTNEKVHSFRNARDARVPMSYCKSGLSLLWIVCCYGYTFCDVSVTQFELLMQLLYNIHYSCDDVITSLLVIIIHVV